MEESKRIRLVFKDDDILSESQKADGLNRSWVFLKPQQHDTVSDVASHLLHAFQLQQSCPHGLLLSISGFVLPPFESTRILKDNEIIRVHKRRDILAIAGNGAANEIQNLKALEEQPVNNGVLLLANEEFEKEKGGYESDDPEEESGEDEQDVLLEDKENPKGGNADPKNRKRKAAEKLQGSKKKKHRSQTTGNVANDVHTENVENLLQNRDLTESESLNAEDNVEKNEGNAKLSEKNHVAKDKRNVEVHENSKETEDAKIVPKETKKVPSRSARRKYAKRRWLREMAKIQKQNATCESEGLRNWKEDHAKAEQKKMDGQLKGLQKWKKHQADAERNEMDGQPKGLLHWKLSPQNNQPVKGKKRKQRNQNDYVLKQHQNGDVHELENQNGDGNGQPTQNDAGLEQPNQKQGDVHEQPGQKSGGVQEHPNQNCDASEQLNQESDEENEVVPIVIRPGHIRFEPLGKEKSVQQNLVPSETIQWNGITSKKKGQQWGKENRSSTPRNDHKHSNKECTDMLSSEKEKQPDKEKQLVKGIDFDKLPPLLSTPKEGDLIAYRILELSSSWTPELSAYQVGKVSWYNAKSNKIMLVPVPEYPIVSEKADEDETAQPDNSLYKEDGSLEIDFSSLIDARIFKHGSSEVSEGSTVDLSTPALALPSRNGTQTNAPTPETGGIDIWEQLSEALNAKKEKLSTKDGWGETPKKVQQSQENSWGESAKKVQPSPENSWGKNVQKVPPSPGSSWGKNAGKVQPSSQDKSWGKQNSGGKSWSYKALRGSALGPTMAILRSKNGI